MTTYNVNDIDRRTLRTSDPPCFSRLGFPLAAMFKEPLVVPTGASGVGPICMPVPVGVALNIALFLCTYKISGIIGKMKIYCRISGLGSF